MMNCPRGCDAVMEYVGIDDGFGDNGELSCDLYECPACGEQVTGDCVADDLVTFYFVSNLPEGGEHDDDE